MSSKYTRHQSSNQNNESSELYSDLIQETLEADDITYELRRVEILNNNENEKNNVNDDDEAENQLFQRLVQTIQDANNDPNVHGILVQYPIFKNSSSCSSNSSSSTTSSSKNESNRRGPYKDIKRVYIINRKIIIYKI